jgi:cell division protein FtsQ
MPRVRKRREIERPSRVKLLLRRQRRNLRVLGLAGVAFAFVIAGMAVLRSAQRGGIVAQLAESFGRATDLRVEKITFSAHPNTPEQRLVAALGVKQGDPILGFSVDAARQRLETLPWIAHVSVERRLPSEIFVDLTEGRPFAIWQTQHKLVLIDHEGGTVENEDVTRFGELPLVVGAGAPAQAANIIELTSQYPTIHPRIDAFVRVGERRWNLLLKNKMVVMLPEGHEAEALTRLAALDQAQALLSRPLLSLDMRLPDKMYVRTDVAETDTPPAADAAHAAKTDAKVAAPVKATAHAASAHPGQAHISPVRILHHSADSVHGDMIAGRRAT